MDRRTLIGNIRVRKTRVFVGEPLAVKVVPLQAKCDESLRVTINGVPGISQYLQFTHHGRKKIFVVASTEKKQSEQRVLEVDVQPRPNDCDSKSLFPIIAVSQNFHMKRGASLRLANSDDFADKDVYYVWNVGGIQLTSIEPRLDYSFEDRLDAKKPYTSFHITLHVKTRHNCKVYTGRRTISVWNTYYMNKRRGFIQLAVDPEIYARREGPNYTGHFTIKNVEQTKVRFTSVQIEYLYNDPEKVVRPQRPNDYEWEIAGKEMLKTEVTIPLKEFPPDAFGFAAHFRGKTASNLLAFADVYFEVRTNPLARRKVNHRELVSILDELRSSKTFLNSDVIPMERLAEHLAVPPECQPGILQGLMKQKTDSARAKKEILKMMGGDIGIVVHALEGDIEGEECTPEDEDNPPEGYVCQLTDEWRWEIIPARILNARKGDVLLSPGANGPVGGLLKQVTPPQVYSHAGMMINNYYRVKHSTASEEWLQDSAGSDGLDPDKLKYAWPGTIEQSIEGAFEGSYFSYEGKMYEISAFSNETKYAENIGLVEPIVVKPDPLVEAELPQVRDMLNRAAESAKEIHGHYRFYCFTNADIFFDDFYKAPNRGGSWWASNSRPTVCSSMVWAAIKRLEDPALMLEGRNTFTRPSDLEPTDVGAEVDLHTRDGLYYYTESERRVAAHWLYSYFYDLAYGEVGFLGLLADVPDDLASQMCNTFAFDWSGEDETGNHAKDSDRWKNPGDGRAVSPDNIKNYWDIPTLEGDVVRGLYGYSEELIYRPARLEFRRVSRWARVAKEATLKGRVLYMGTSVAGAVVKVAGLDRVTNGSGEFELTVPAGSYRVEASKVIDGWFMSVQHEAVLAAGEEKLIVLILEEPDEMFRVVTVRGSMYIVDDEWGDDETATRNVFMSGIRIGPFGTHAERSQTEKMGGEVRVEMRLKLDWRLDASIDVWYKVQLFEGTSEETNDLEDTKTGTINVPKDRTVPLTLRLVNTEFDGGDTADINLQISNDRQP